eukprot:scpid77117/ scgid20266/ 
MEMSMMMTMTTFYYLIFSVAHNRFVRVPRPNLRGIPEANNSSDTARSAVYLDQRCSVKGLFTLQDAGSARHSDDHRQVQIFGYNSQLPLVLKKEKSVSHFVHLPAANASEYLSTESRPGMSSTFVFQRQANGRFRILDEDEKLALVAVTPVLLRFVPVEQLTTIPDLVSAEFRLFATEKMQLRMMRCNDRVRSNRLRR